LPGAALPDDGCLALVGNSHRRDRAAGVLGSLLDHLLRALPDLARVVLDVARLRVDLLVLELLDGYDVATVVEHHAARAGRSLVQRCDVISFLSFQPASASAAVWQR
jgi:hypothetical protein